MTKPIKLSSLPEFDITLYLDSDEAIADYLNAVIEDGDSSLLAAALGVRMHVEPIAKSSL